MPKEHQGCKVAVRTVRTGDVSLGMGCVGICVAVKGDRLNNLNIPVHWASGFTRHGWGRGVPAPPPGFCFNMGAYFFCTRLGREEIRPSAITAKSGFFMAPILAHQPAFLKRSLTLTGICIDSRAAGILSVVICNDLELQKCLHGWPNNL